VREELARAAFAVAPSLCYENSPLSVVEAMAAGRPVVAPRSTALGEMLDDGRTGWLFQVGDARELVEACQRLVADPARAQQMGRDARSDYEDRFAPERSLERLVALYDEVLESA
jgi:glycosyltransferase involved in cell wall biosynthesis